MDDQIDQELLKRSFSLSEQIFNALLEHAALVETHGAIGVIVGTQNLQTLVNKKFGGVTDYSEFESNGFLHHAGKSGGYDDIQFNMTPKSTGAGHPTLATWNTDFEEWSYAVGDHANGVGGEVPHWWKEGENWSPHIHWTTGSGNYVSGDKVQWRVFICAADSKETAPYTQFPAATVLDIEHVFSETVLPFSGVRSKFPDFTIPASLTKIGGQIKVKIQRIAKSAGGTNPGTDPFVLQVGAHALSDTRTSRTIGSK